MHDDLRNLPLELAKVADLEFLQARYEVEAERENIERTVSSALATYPNHGVALAARGWSSFARDDFEDAAKWFVKALESVDVTPERESDWLTYLGGCRLRCGDWKSAVQHLVRARNLFPHRPRCHFVLGATFREIGDMISSKLSMAIAAWLTKEITQEELFAKLVHEKVFAEPERLEASLRVLANPLDAAVRIVRGESMKNLESPKAALYDFMMADALAPGNLGVIVRIEEIQVKGLLAGPPVYDVPKADRRLDPVFEEFLASFREAYASLFMPPELQPPLSALEGVFGPACYIPEATPAQQYLVPVFAGIIGFVSFALAALVIGLVASVLVRPDFIPLLNQEWYVYALSFGLGTVISVFALASFLWLVFGCYWSHFGLLWVNDRYLRENRLLAIIVGIPFALSIPIVYVLYFAACIFLTGLPFVGLVLLAGRFQAEIEEYFVLLIAAIVLGSAILVARVLGLDLEKPLFEQKNPGA